MISAWWLIPTVIGTVILCYADEIADWMRRGGGLSGGR